MVPRNCALTCLGGRQLWGQTSTSSVMKVVNFLQSNQLSPFCLRIFSPSPLGKWHYLLMQILSTQLKSTYVVHKPQRAPACLCLDILSKQIRWLILKKNTQVEEVGAFFSRLIFRDEQLINVEMTRINLRLDTCSRTIYLLFALCFFFVPLSTQLLHNNF